MERKNFFAVIDDGHVNYVRLCDAKAVVTPANVGRDHFCADTSAGGFGTDAHVYDLGNPAHLRHLAFLLEVEAAKQSPSPHEGDFHYSQQADTIIHGC